MSLTEVLRLGVRERGASCDRRQFVLADAARQDLVLAGVGVELPGTRWILIERDGEQEVVGADVEHLATGVDLALQDRRRADNEKSSDHQQGLDRAFRGHKDDSYLSYGVDVTRRSVPMISSPLASAFTKNPEPLFKT